MPVGLALPLAIGAGSFLSGLFGNREKKKQAEAQKRADADKVKAENERQARAKSAFDSNEQARVGSSQARMDAIQAMLGRGGGKYAIDPSAFAAMRAAVQPRQFVGEAAATPGADPGAGLGSGFLSGLFGGMSDAAKTILMGKLQDEAGAPGEFAGPPASMISRGAPPQAPPPAQLPPQVNLGLPQVPLRLPGF
jgi:hypothetical protein